MRSWMIAAAIAVAAVGASPPSGRAAAGEDPAAPWNAAFDHYVAALRPESAAAARFAFADAARLDWHFIPRERQGLPLGAMNSDERRATHALLRTFLSPLGYERALGVMELEAVLREIEGNPGRDPGRYYVSCFGAPAASGETPAPWMVRVEGHHLALQFTAVPGRGVAPTPFFLGANPAEVQSGDHAGRQLLADLEQGARALLAALTPAQRALAVFATTAPADVLFGPGTSPPDGSVGIALSDLSTEQRALATALERAVTGNVAASLTPTDSAVAHFAWAGGLEAGDGHYWRLTGPTAAIEYDNTQNDANHVHLLWRDAANDFGADWLAEHVKREHPR